MTLWVTYEVVNNVHGPYIWSHSLIESDICDIWMDTKKIWVMVRLDYVLKRHKANTRERAYTITQKERKSSLHPRMTFSSQFWFKNLKRNLLLQPMQDHIHQLKYGSCS